MNRSTLVAGAAAIVSLAGAFVALLVADGQLDDRRNELLSTGCKKSVEVPGAATALNYVGAVLLIVSTVSLVWLVVALAKGSSRLKPLSITIAAVALVGVGLYAALVTAGTISPGSNEPSSPRYHPCPSRI
ncbi:hypothetical protein [Nocardia mexicana]|uniref:Uncharacterized protein n=1 Tax=Nocardia mexicana TaxID=279262 RepID=A0A370HB03_9NOCA|nr:hypothetical protein [Nocardia mexicana]RDI54102.1 hypothetical protein DFR68_102226 [Nocardia mexicana]